MSLKESVLLKGATLIGFADRNVCGKSLDVAIGADGRVAATGNLVQEDWDNVFDVQSCYLSPGWIDLHTHVYKVGRAGLDPTLIGPLYGVAGLVDAGSAGEATFAGLKEYVVDPADFPIRVFLNIGSFGSVSYEHESIDLSKTSERVEQNRDVIRGIKVLASKRYIKGCWIHPVVAAKRLAFDLDLPLMVHVAEPPVYLEELVNDILGSGDIITHCFHGKVGNSVRSSPSRVIALYRQAVEKGILLDVAHGAASFSFESARVAIEQGVKPATISTDLHQGNINGPVWSLATVMSKMLACGLDLQEVVEMVAINPATILGEVSHGSLEPGAKASFTVFDVKKGDFTFSDSGARDDYTSGSDISSQNMFPGDVFVRPQHTCLGNSVIKARAYGLKQNLNSVAGK